MTKSWLDLFETRADRLPGNLSEGIIKIDDEGNLDFILPDKKAEHKFKKAIVHFFVEYFFMTERIHLKDFMESLERAILIKILSKFNGNQRNTAEFLGLNHTTLNQKIKKHNIRFRKTAILD
jgi:DNA-binding NtrC family response regulator